MLQPALLVIDLHLPTTAPIILIGQCLGLQTQTNIENVGRRDDNRSGPTGIASPYPYGHTRPLKFNSLSARSQTHSGRERGWRWGWGAIKISLNPTPNFQTYIRYDCQLNELSIFLH